MKIELPQELIFCMGLQNVGGHLRLQKTNHLIFFDFVEYIIISDYISISKKSFRMILAFLPAKKYSNIHLCVAEFTFSDFVTFKNGVL